MGASVDPGYGDPLAPVGTPEWAKRWRLEFQGAAESLPRSPELNVKLYELGVEHRAWTLVTDKYGNFFGTFEEFCRYRRPWGLQTDPAKFMAYMEVVKGKKAVELATVAPDGRMNNGANQHTGQIEDSRTECGNPEGQSPRKREALRAILRAPELVQQMYREDMITQKTAARMGPSKPTPEEAAKVAETRQALESVDRSQPLVEVRKETKRIVDSILGAVGPTALEAALNAYRKLNSEEKDRFKREMDLEGNDQ